MSSPTSSRAAASSIYESLEFTAESQNASQRICDGVQRLSAACRSTASQFLSVMRAARSSQPPSIAVHGDNKRPAALLGISRTPAFDTRQTERSKTPARVASAAAYALGLGDGRPAVWREIETGVLSGPQVGQLQEWPQPPH